MFSVHLVLCFRVLLFRLSSFRAADRVAILKALSSSVALGPDVNLEAVGTSPKVRRSNLPRLCQVP